MKIQLTPPLPSIEIDAGHYQLRCFTEEDAPLIEAASQDSFISKITTVPSASEYSEAEALAFIDRQNGRLRDGEGWSLAIMDQTSGIAVGQIGLWLAQARKGRAEIGYWVAEPFRGQGAAGQAVNALAIWAFEHLDLDRLSLFIEPWNAGSMVTAERAGFQRETELRAWERVGGEPKNMLVFSRFRSDEQASGADPHNETWPTTQPTLEGTGFVLRPWATSDVDAVTAACQDEDIQRWTTVPSPYLPDHALGFITQIATSHWRDRSGVACCISDASGAVLGSCSLFEIDPNTQISQLGYWVGPNARGRKLAAQSIRLLSEWGFKTLDLQRIELLIEPSNTASIRAAENADCRFEGILTSRIVHRGERKDVAIYSLLPPEAEGDSLAAQ